MPPVAPRTTLGLVVSVAVRLATIAVVLGGGTMVFLLLVSTRPELAGEPHGAVEQRVVAFEPRLVPVRRQWSGYGTVEAVTDAAVPARVSAIVLERPEAAREGRSIDRGDLIVRLDPSDFEKQFEIAEQAIAELDAQLARLEIEAVSWGERVRLAESDAELARSDLERVREAVANEAAKDREVDAARQRVIAAERVLIAAREELDKIPARRVGLEALRAGQEAQRRLAQLSIERCEVTSPIAGVLAAVDIELGESVQPGQRVARVVALERVEVPLLLPASARDSVRVGDEVLLYDEGRGGLGSRTWRATVGRVAPADDPSTRTMAVYAEVVQDPAGPDLLAPGRFVQGSVVAAESTPRLVLPRRAVRSDRIFVVHEGRLLQREVVPEFSIRGSFPELDLPDTEWLVLRDPLPPGDQVVLQGSRSLVEGVPAAAVPWRQAPMAAEAGAAGRGDAAP